MSDKKIQWGMLIGGAVAAAVLTALVIWLLGGLSPREGREVRAALRVFLGQLAQGKGPVATASPDRRLTSRWLAVARHGDLEKVYERGRRAAAFLVVPAAKMPGVDLADLKRRLERHQRLLGKPPRRPSFPESNTRGNTMDLISWAARQAGRGRVVVFIRLRRIHGGWRVVYPSGLFVVGSR